MYGEKHMTELLRRAWDALDTFKQAYPENWHNEDEQVLKDLIRADLKLSGVQLKWVGLTKEEIAEFDTWHDNREEEVGWVNPSEIVAYISKKLRSKNT
jgi:hypothetical protein